MKILQLGFKNLNSLYGEWCIDFTHPQYTDSGIFALTGPTGSGKSTLLDALCLALYGATPRLGKITKSGNDIMSRQTAECYAEVLFESQSKRYLCRWEQRKARKNITGNLLDQEHQIVDGDTGKIIESKRSLVAGIVEEKTGMDFERFTRSVLLAQGSFDSFLKADAEQKSRILEQITGTEIYSLISRRVHEQKREQQENLKTLEAEAAGFSLLDTEQEQQLQLQLQNEQQEMAALSEQLQQIGSAIAWLSLLESLKAEIEALAGEKERLQKEWEHFAPELQKYERAQKAVPLEGGYQLFETLREQQKRDTLFLEQQGSLLSNLEERAFAEETRLEQAKQRALQCKEALHESAPLIQKIRLLDAQLAGQRRGILEAEKNHLQLTKTLEGLRESLREQANSLDAIFKEKQSVEAYLQENRQDAWLIGGFSALEQQVCALQALQEALCTRQKEQALLQADLEASACRIEQRKKETAESGERVYEWTREREQIQETLERQLEGRLLREYRTEKENLLRERAYIRTIEELQEQRKQLQDGKACPLCGATRHPFAEGNVPEPNRIERQIEALSERIAQAERLESELQKVGQQLLAAQQQANRAEMLQVECESERQAIQTKLLDRETTVQQIQGDLQQLQSSLADKLTPLGLGHTCATTPTSLLEVLQQRLEEWQKQVARKEEISGRYRSSESEIQRLQAVIETQESQERERLKTRESLQQEHRHACDERLKLFGEKDTESEQERLEQDSNHADHEQQLAQQQVVAVQEQLVRARSEQGAVEKSIRLRAPELQRAEENFAQQLKEASFLTPETFLSARLPLAEREQLATRAKKLEQQQAELNARQKDREQRLLQENEKRVTEKSAERLNTEQQECLTQVKQLQQSSSALEYRLQKNRETQELISGKQASIEAQKRECERWNSLHELIGSSDGKKYRNFAQGLTFELMIAHANRQLRKMNDRYALFRDTEQPLELNVIDNYQAGEIRSTRNLSGGESFIISLALALGLSKMASRKVRVDSLFLDEGFGTLDDEALEGALESLASLKQEGKLIGVISHVPALKERIDTQIRVRPLSGGRSALQGPGCVKKDRAAH